MSHSRHEPTRSAIYKLTSEPRQQRILRAIDLPRRLARRLPVKRLRKTL